MFVARASLTTPPPASNPQPIPPTSVQLSVSVPADAKVFVNGLPTKSTGERRLYASSGVQPSAIYSYQGPRSNSFATANPSAKRKPFN